MRWKGSSARSERYGTKEENDFFARVKQDTPTLRKQGVSPERDPTTFSRYQCDLCNGSFPLTELKQCTLCGRWACPECWTSEFYICRSCNGNVQLHLLALRQKGKGRENP